MPNSKHDNESNDGPKDRKNQNVRAIILIIVVAAILFGALAFIAWYFVNEHSERIRFLTVNTLSLLVMVVIAVQAYIYRKQWGVMQAQTEIARKAANAAELSAKTAQDALRIGERPSLGVIKTTLTAFSPNEVPVAKLEVKNTGRVPSTRTSVHAAMNIRAEDRCPEPILPTLAREQSRSVIAINAERHSFATTNRRLSVAEFEGVQVGRLWIYVYVMIRYSDSQGGDYFTEYYARFLPTVGQFEDCPTHNDAN